MRRNLVLSALMAFCVALGAGRMIFKNATPTGRVAESRELPVVPVSAAKTSESSDTTQVRKTKSADEIDRNFHEVDGGVSNENPRMSAFVSHQYQEGVLFQALHSFGETVRWFPTAEEIRHGHEVLGVMSKPANAKGVLQQADDCNHYVYNETYPGTDERMYMRPEGGIEHDIILKSAPRSIDNMRNLAFSGYLQLGSGLTLWDGDKQITTSHTTRHGLLIKNAMNNPVFCLRPPLAWDASVTNLDGTLNKELQAEEDHLHALTGCEYHIDFHDSGVKLAVVTPGKWLSSKDRVFPVVIDPNLGPFGLADGSPPLYVATQGSDTLIPASSGGTKVNYKNATLVGVQNVPLPFPFVYKGTTFNSINLHIDGYADFNPPNFTPDTPANVALPAPEPQFDFTMFVYWSALKFSTDPTSGVYFFTDGVAPNRRFIVEWHKMGFNRTTSQSNAQISFNLILFECTNNFEFIIGTSGDTDPGFATVGEQVPPDPGNPPIERFIQFDFNSATSGTFDPTTGQITPLPPITPGTALTFSQSAVAGLTVTPTNAAGCVPFTVCFNATVAQPPSNCGQASAAPTVGFHWVFGDNTEAFTPSVCHTYVTPNSYTPTLTVTDSLGIQSPGPAITINVCDVPRVIIQATPQGGVAPLDIHLTEVTGDPATVTITGQPTWFIDLLPPDNAPNNATRVASTTGSSVDVRLDQPGLYKVTVFVNGTDTISGGQPTGAFGTVFIFVANPTDVVNDTMVITDSVMEINWASKLRTDLDFANPNADTISMTGFFSLPGITQSELLNRNVRVTLNGTKTIFEGVLDASGHASFGTPATPPGPAGDFQLSLPSGQFTFTCNGDFFVPFGVVNTTERRLLAADFLFEIQDIFPPANYNGAIITYDYESVMFQPGPPPTGSAHGEYHMGLHTIQGPLSGFTGIKKLPPDLRRPGGQTLFVSGAFQVLSANFILEGNTVFADISGVIARFGGDSLRPQASSDVVTTIGVTTNGNQNFSQTLNFGTTPTFKTTGKAPRTHVTFKASKSAGNNGIQFLSWSNVPGDFRIKTGGIPNDGVNGVGLNPNVGVQTLTLGLTITPDSGQVFRGVARFDLTKISPTQFVHLVSTKAKKH